MEAAVAVRQNVPHCFVFCMRRVSFPSPAAYVQSSRLLSINFIGKRNQQACQVGVHQVQIATIVDCSGRGRPPRYCRIVRCVQLCRRRLRTPWSNEHPTILDLSISLNLYPPLSLSLFS